MAERRMFAKTVVLSDAFLDMPSSARCLYFTLGMFADDDGFVNNPKSIMRQCGSSMDDMNILLLKKFLIQFDDGVIVIKHWKIHNYIQKDRYVPTKYEEHKQCLALDENKAYTRSVSKMYTQDRLGKVSIVENKESVKESNKVADTHSKRFIKPTLEQVKDYCTERNNNVDAEKFMDFYESKDWYIGKNKMKDWKACVRTWERERKPTNSTSKNFAERNYSKNELNEMFSDLHNLDDIEI